MNSFIRKLLVACAARLARREEGKIGIWNLKLDDLKETKLTIKQMKRALQWP
jgi:hypothetical protein